jgi:hypothetical protein
MRSEAHFPPQGLPGELGGQGLELGVEFVVLAFEEDRDLTEHLRIADRIEPKHTRTTSSRRG